MKIAKFITTFLLLFVLGMFISYANVIYNNWTNDFIEAFEQTDAKFKFYNIKINTVVPDIKSEEEIKQICIDIMNCFNISENQISWNIKGNEKEAQIYTKVKDNIRDIYQTLNKVLNSHSNDVEIAMCIVGEYTKNLQLYKFNDILKNILYNMNAKEIDKIRNNNYISVTAYSNLLKENDLEYLENKINLNIGIRYSENEDKTLIYMATPIIKLDY